MVFKDDESRRTFEEFLKDQLLSLYLIHKTNSVGVMDGLVKLNKLIFVSEVQGLKRRFKTFHYHMYKWDMGPYDHEIRMDFENLVENSLVQINEASVGIRLTRQGEETLKEFMHLVPKRVVNNVNWTCETFGKINAFALKNITHGFKVKINGRLVKIDELPNDRDQGIFEDYFKENPRDSEVDETLLDDLELSINKDARNALYGAEGQLSSGGLGDATKFTPL